ncbi:MAG: TonB-dependent receptor [Pseudomonadota bacterium]
MNTLKLAGASVAALILAAPIATSQEAPTEETKRLQNITVTGEKIERSLQDTQASVAVVTQQQIEDLGIESFRDAFRTMANVIDADWVDAGFVIRGVNSEGLTPGGEALATLYIDGAPQTVQGARRGGRGLWDVQQVEVYRGPQSTLSGRASLAGAIYITTQDPMFEPDLRARVTVGELETLQAAIAGGGAIVKDRIAWRVAAEYIRDESDLNYPGYEQFDLFDNFIEDEYYQIRGKLLFEPESATGWRGLLSASFSSDSPNYDDIAGPGLGFEYSEQRGDLNAGLPFFQDNREAENTSASLRLTRPIGETMQVTLLGTYADTTVDRPSINAGTEGETFTSVGTIEQERLSFEANLSRDAGEDAISWVAGVYVESEETFADNERSVFFGGGRTDFGETDQELFNIAAFGEVTWPVADTVDIIAGGRLLYEERDESSFSRRTFFNGDPAVESLNDPGASDTVEVLPKVGIVWDFTQGQSLGFTAQRGYRGGGSFIDNINNTTETFDAESTWTYEIAYRSEFLGGRGRLNANLFYTDWSDQQVNFQRIPGDPLSDAVVNAGESSLQGLEVEGRYLFTDAFSGFASVGLLDTEFDDFNTSDFGDLSGLPFPEAPEYTVAFGLDYNTGSGFFAGADAKVVDEYLARDLQNAPVDPVGDYTVVNLRAGYQFDSFTVTVFSDNAFDEEYFVYRDRIGDFDCCATLGPRRVTGVTLEAEF